MNVFEFTNYKDFIHKNIKQLPGRGRGELSKIAKILNVHSTMLTHILKGKANLTNEQSLALSEYLNFNALETEYFLALVQMERAGDERARKYFKSKITDLKNKALNLDQRLNFKNQLSESDRALYYSNWMYAAIRLLTSIERYQSLDAIATELQLPVNKIRKIIEFLCECKLCVRENDKIKYGPLNTYLESSSHLVSRHHLNWRQKSQEKFDNLKDTDLVFTYPVTLSEKDATLVREKLVLLIEDIKKNCEQSPSDLLYMFNIDWVKFTK